MNNVQRIFLPESVRPLFLFFLCWLWAPVGLSADNAKDQMVYSEIMPLAHKSLLLDIGRAGNVLVAVGERGHVLISEDSGKSWKQAAQVPTRATLTAVYGVGKNIWAVGHDTTIIHSGDGGTTWEVQFSDPAREAPLLDVYFSDAHTGYAIGAYGAYLTTADGGQTWHDGVLVDDDDFHLNAIIPLQADGLFIVAEGGTAYRSDDAGLTWKRLHLPYSGSMFGALYLSERIITFGLRGHVFASSDNGETWETLLSPVSSSLFGGTILGANSAVLVGANGTILVLKGNQFTSQGQPLGGEDLSAVLAVTSQRLIITGEGGIHLLKLTADVNKATVTNSEQTENADNG